MQLIIGVSVAETAVWVGSVVAVGGSDVSVGIKVGVGVSVLVARTSAGSVTVLAISPSRESVSSKVPPQATKSITIMSRRKRNDLFIKSL